MESRQDPDKDSIHKVPEDQELQRSPVSLDPLSVDRDSESSVVLHPDDDLQYMRGPKKNFSI